MKRQGKPPKKKKYQGGFTLTELMVVVVIIGILVAVAVPVYSVLENAAIENAHQANIRTIHGAVQNYVAAHGLPDFEGEWEGARTTLVPAFLQEWPTHPGGINGDYKVTGGFSYTVEFVPE